MGLYVYDKYPLDTLDLQTGDCCIVTTDSCSKPFKVVVSKVHKYINYKGGYTTLYVYFKELKCTVKIKSIKVLWST